MERCSCLCCFVRVRCTLSRSGGTAQLLPHAYGREGGGGGAGRGLGLGSGTQCSAYFIFLPQSSQAFFPQCFVSMCAMWLVKGKKAVL